MSANRVSQRCGSCLVHDGRLNQRRCSRDSSCTVLEKGRGRCVLQRKNESGSTQLSGT